MNSISGKTSNFLGLHFITRIVACLPPAISVDYERDVSIVPLVTERLYLEIRVNKYVSFVYCVSTIDSYNNPYGTYLK